VSKSNIYEAQLTLSLVKAILATAEKTLSTFQGKIGIVTPYKAQVHHLKNLFVQSFGIKKEALRSVIQISSVDAFQGSEKDIMIFNAVRSNNITHSILNSLGFTSDLRRLNVAITRPKHFLFIIGHEQTLSRDQMWYEFIEHHKVRRGCYYHLSSPVQSYNEKSLIHIMGKKMPVAQK